MRIALTSVFVDDQAKALAFYTDVLGFVKKQDIPMGGARWLTVVSPEDPNGSELVLEPNGNPAAAAYQAALLAQGIPRRRSRSRTPPPSTSGCEPAVWCSACLPPKRAR